MSWNYRIVKYADESGFGIHEVHYDKDGKEISMTENPVAFVGDTAEEVRGALMMAKMDSTKRPVFQEPKKWMRRERIKALNEDSHNRAMERADIINMQDDA